MSINLEMRHIQIIYFKQRLITEFLLDIYKKENEKERYSNNDLRSKMLQA